MTSEALDGQLQLCYAARARGLNVRRKRNVLDYVLTEVESYSTKYQCTARVMCVMVVMSGTHLQRWTLAQFIHVSQSYNRYIADSSSQPVTLCLFT